MNFIQAAEFNLLPWQLKHQTCEIILKNLLLRSHKEDETPLLNMNFAHVAELHWLPWQQKNVEKYNKKCLLKSHKDNEAYASKKCFPLQKVSCIAIASTLMSLWQLRISIEV